VSRFVLTWRDELHRGGLAIGRLDGRTLRWGGRTWEMRTSLSLTRRHDLVDLATGAWAGWFAARGPLTDNGSMAVGRDVFEWQRPSFWRSRRVLLREGAELVRFQPRARLGEQMTIEVAPAAEALEWLPLILLAGSWLTLAQNAAGSGGHRGGAGPGPGLPSTSWTGGS
jgi:hypothetical protein